MKSQKLIIALGLVVSVFVIWIGLETFTQPGIADLNAKYVELAKYRNENNTGPITRIYAVHASDTLWSEFLQYGDHMPHTKYGNTKVFFFSSEPEDSIRLFPQPPYIEAHPEEYCVAVYEKTAMGEVSLLKFPFQ